MVNQLTYIDDHEAFAKKEKELEILIQSMRIYSQDIRMEFGIEKCSILIIKSEKWIILSN